MLENLKKKDEELREKEMLTLYKKKNSKSPIFFLVFYKMK